MALAVNSPTHLGQELTARAKGLAVEIVPYVSDSLSTIAEADLVVCMAGYNTLSEVLFVGKKALVIPRSGPSAEQRMRSALLAQRGLIDVLYPENVCFAVSTPIIRRPSWHHTRKRGEAVSPRPGAR